MGGRNLIYGVDSKEFRKLKQGYVGVEWIKYCWQVPEVHTQLMHRYGKLMISLSGA